MTGKSNNVKSLSEASKPMGLIKIGKLGHGHICLKEEYISLYE